MKIGAEDVRHVAQLAELAVADADVTLLAAQLDGIVNFVAQLDEVAIDGTAGHRGRRPAQSCGCARISSIRSRWRGRRRSMAPAFQHGFFVVPRLGGMAEE